MKHGKITRSGDRTAQSSEFNVSAPGLRQSVFAVRVALGSFATATALQLAAPAAYALPTGEQLISGNATVSRNSSNTVMDINQSTQNAGFNWTSFSIAKPETVNVVQPNSSSVLLNRVVGNEQSRIFGALNANGRVFLVNPNGILFAPGASVNVGGLVASSLDMTKENFDSGKYVFSPRPGAPAAGVVNQAKIVAVDGYAALIGPKVANEGVIVARTMAPPASRTPPRLSWERARRSTRAQSTPATAATLPCGQTARPACTAPSPRGVALNLATAALSRLPAKPASKFAALASTRAHRMAAPATGSSTRMTSLSSMPPLPLLPRVARSMAARRTRSSRPPRRLLRTPTSTTP